MKVVPDKSNIDSVVYNFISPRTDYSISVLGNGHINQTYLITSAERSFVLQKINNYVFKQPAAVIQNAVEICDYLSAKHSQNEYALQSIACLKTSEDQYHVNFQNEYWRALSYIPNTLSVESVASTDQARNTAKAFGFFGAALSSFNANQLNVIIADFHNLTFRFEQLKSSIKQDTKARVANCQQEIDLVTSNAKLVENVAKVLAKLPIRVTHNDTKINNLLVDKNSHEPIAVVDLDTCMPGYLMHDFGDMVRTCCSNLAEDDINTKSMTFNFDIFDALADGYLSAWKGKIAAVEVDSLALGALIMPLMIGIRFLTDYIDGDNYFATQHENHNLDRAKNQFSLFSLIKNCQSELETCLKLKV